MGSYLIYDVCSDVLRSMPEICVLTRRNGQTERHGENDSTNHVYIYFVGSCILLVLLWGFIYIVSSSITQHNLNIKNKT